MKCGWQTPLLMMVLLTSTAWTRAQDIEPVKREAIRELLEITRAQADQSQLTQTFTRQLISVLQANAIDLNEAEIRVIAVEVDAVVTEQLQREALQERIYRIYARYFTLEELEGLIAFNRSPVGQKANRVMPALLRESSLAAQAWSEEIGPELSARVKARPPSSP